jgi:toxin-antitoxin system PIN domain toxin
MIVPDINLLVCAYNVDSPRHPEARRWWERTLAGPRPVGLAWVVMLGYIRVATHRAILRNPMPPAHAIRHVRSWISAPSAQILTPAEAHGEILFRLLEELGVAGNLTTDAHLAALAMEYQAELASTDADFSRFRGLRWFNPLEV